MTNAFGIPENELRKIRTRDKRCVYCHKDMVYPFNSEKRKASATIEHLNYNGPFNWKDGLQLDDIAICCFQCNSSRGKKKLQDWFKSKYCIERNINENTISKPVKSYLKKKK